ncbi:MAG: YiiX/YebB-like N1pC/P60 family cysteine hydrolase [Pseudomonadota bacterium]
MTYHHNQHSGARGRQLSSGGDGTGYPPPRGSYIRLAPSADAVRDISQSSLQPGDLILSTSAAWISKEIRGQTRSPVSHVAIYIGDGQVIEAIEGGVTIHSLTNALSDDYYAAAYRVDGLTPDDRQRMVRWLRTQEGRPYDTWGIVGQVTGASDYINEEDAWFCSELTFAAYEHIEKPLTTTSPGDSTPGQILTLSGVSYLGHLKRPGRSASQSVRSFSGSGDSSNGGIFAPDEAQRDAMIPAGQGGMSIGVSALEVGDIIATSGNAAISAAIRSHTNAPVSHLALYIGDGMIIEAVSNGVVQNTLSRSLNSSDFAAAYRVPGLTPAQRRQIKAFALDAEARRVPYDYTAIASLQYFQDDGALFCSELVFEAYESAGRSIGNPQQSNPGQVITLRGIEYLGHLPTQRLSGASPQHYRSGAMSTGLDDVIQAAINAGATEAEARAYFGGATAQSLSSRQVTLPNVNFTSASSPMMAGIATLVNRMLPASLAGGKTPLDHLFDYCTRNNVCLALGLQGSGPAGLAAFINIGMSGGIVVAPNRRAGLYFSGNIGVGWNLEVAGGLEVVLVKGGESKFNGLSVVLGGSVDASEGPGVGFRYILDTSGRVVGVIGELNFSIGVPGASAIELTAAIAWTESVTWAFSARPMSSGHGGKEEAIRAAMENGASEQEARAFFSTSPMSSPMATALSDGTIPPYTPLTGWRKAAILVGVFQLIGLSGVAMLAYCRRKNISVGVGYGLSGGLGGVAGGGVGVVFLPNGDMAMYGSAGIGGGWIFEAALTVDLTLINGDASVFFGESLVVGGSISLDAGVSVGGGARLIMPPGGGTPVGLLLQVSAGFGLPIVSTVEATLQETTTTPLSFSQSYRASAMMIGGLPLNTPERGALRNRPSSNVIPFTTRARTRTSAAHTSHDERSHRRSSTWM